MAFRPLVTAVKAISLVVICASVAGCGSISPSEMTFFPNSGSLFKSQDWGSSTSRVAVADVLPSGPVSPEDEVDAAGRCAIVARAQPEVSVGSIAGDLGTTASVAPVEQSLVPGGVSLGMTECQVVSHAGQPGQVDIGAYETGERKVVLTYMSGPWPGMYTFQSGRLKVVDRVAVPEPAKPVKKKARSAKTASTSR